MHWLSLGEDLITTVTSLLTTYSFSARSANFCLSKLSPCHDLPNPLQRLFNIPWSLDKINWLG